MSTPLERKLFTVEEYHQMGASGILGEGRFELLHGEIFKRSPIKSLHAGTIKKIVALLSGKIKDQPLLLEIQDPITLADYSEPEPDITILKYKDSYYTDAHPTAEDILLLIEVSDSTYQTDKQVKLPIYAQAGVPEYWILNLKTRELEIHTQPQGDYYRHLEFIKAENTVHVESLNLTIQLQALLP